jgi:hypothetical protein
MPNLFKKVKPLVSKSDFLLRAKSVSKFTSSRGRRYFVKKIENEEMFFIRLDARNDREWSMNLNEVYHAYQMLDDFATINFKRFVPIRHSPARGLLLHLGMLE